MSAYTSIYKSIPNLELSIQVFILLDWLKPLRNSHQIPIWYEIQMVLCSGAHILICAQRHPKLSSISSISH